MNLMFEPIASELKVLENDGCLFKLHDGSCIRARAVVLSGHFDTPAKDDFLQKIHHNGYFGCSFCEEKGESCKSGKGHTHVYPYNLCTESGYGKLRTHSSFLSQAQEAITLGKSVYGIKNKPAFSSLKYFNLIHSIAVDYMHTVCLGVVKRLLTLWFSQEYKSDPWFIGNRVSEVDQRLMKICPPNSLTRTPRPIKEHRKHFKASELKMWLLHYGPVCVKNVLPNAYYHHFLYLNKGIYLLLSSSISQKDLDDSAKCLQSFCVLTRELYGERFMTINFHLLLHTVESVRHLGPLWSSSCFSFEDYNRHLINSFHGTQHIHTQILNAVTFLSKSATLCKKLQEK